jgi:hypothetical protein
MTTETPQDGRRLLYRLAPAIPVTKTERGWEMDFGYCLVRGGVLSTKLLQAPQSA